VRDIYSQEGRGVAFISAHGVTSDSNSPFGLPQEGDATGSGFVVDKDGYIVTNAHVVEGADSVDVSFDENGDSIPADVKGVDTDSDVAVLKVDPSKVKNLTPIPLGDSSKAQVGDPVIAIGNPFGYSRTVTTGIVSGLQRQIQAPNGFTISNVIQTDASINPGNSGGPLLDANGRVIGINSQIATGGGQGSVGIGFAVPINTAKKLLPDLKAGETIERAYLGVQMQGVTKQLADDLNLAADHGALIVEVTRDSPADKAGLRGGRTQTSSGIAAGGDLIVAIDGKSMRDEDAVANAIAAHRPGDKVDIEYYRGNDKKTVTVELTKRPASAESSAPSDQGGGGNGGGGVLP
jgi:S1-C subfamily serine protease